MQIVRHFDQVLKLKMAIISEVWSPYLKVVYDSKGLVRKLFVNDFVFEAENKSGRTGGQYTHRGHDSLFWGGLNLPPLCLGEIPREFAKFCAPRQR